MVARHLSWGEDRVFYYSPNGRLKSFLVNVTDLFPVDAFTRISAGRSAFRVDDLLELRERLVIRNKSARGFCVQLSSCEPFETIFVMQATQDRLGNDTVILGNAIPRGCLLRQTPGRIRDPRPQASVRTAPIVMVYPLFEGSPQVLLVQRN
jgi:hypothetical protein